MRLINEKINQLILYSIELVLNTAFFFISIPSKFRQNVYNIYNIEEDFYWLWEDEWKLMIKLNFFLEAIQNLVKRIVNSMNYIWLFEYD